MTSRPRPMRHFVDQVFAGNISQAAAALGMPWTTVKGRYNGAHNSEIPCEKIADALEIAKERGAEFTLRDALPLTGGEFSNLLEHMPNG